MRSYIELARINARHSRRQSRMTILCIILAVFLVTSVFSMADFERMHMTEKLIRDHGNWHIVLSHIPETEALGIKNEANVKALCAYGVFNYDVNKPYYLDGSSVCVIGTEKTFFDDIVSDTLKEGRYPQDDSEILLNNNAKLVSDFKTGDTAVINTPAGKYAYRVCGFISDTSNSLASDAVIAVMTPSAFRSIADANGEVSEVQYYVRFEKSLKIADTIAKLKESHGWTEENVGENAAVLGIMCMSTNNYIMGLYGAAAVLVVLVILAGVLMISGSMNANVAERTQFFGMLRCIGASKRQVRRIVRSEALSWLKLAIPIGAVLSVAACWGVCALLAFGIGGEWEGMPVGKFSVVGIAVGILVGFITVLTAAGAPARRASSVSPVAAVSGQTNGGYTGKAVKLWFFSVPVSLGIRHTVSRKKNLILMTGSFALSIILFLAFSVMIVWIGNALTTNKPYTPDICLYYERYSKELSHGFADELRSVEGVEYVYGRMYSPTEAEYSGITAEADLISYDDIQFEWAKKDVLRGDIKKAQNEKGNVITVYGTGGNLSVGDAVTVNGKTLNVSAVLSDSPFGVGETLTVICSEETFAEACGEKGYSVIEIQLGKDGGDGTVAKIRSMSADGVILSDRRASKTEVNSTYLAFSIMVYGFLFLVALITAVNIVNSISMSVAARRRQYGIMRAVGLDKRQLVRMITAESLCFGVFGCIAGCAIGLPLNAMFFRAIVTNYWGVPWRLPYAELIIIVAVVILSSLAAVYFPAKRLKEAPIVDTIKD